MAQAPELELKDLLLSNSSFGPNEISFIRRRVCNDYSQLGELKDVTAELESQTDRTPAAAVRFGICLFMLGRYSEAIEILGNADGGALAYFYQGKCHFALGAQDKAQECYESAQKAGYNADLCMLAVAEAKRLALDLPGAMGILDNMFGPVEQTAEYLFQRGACLLYTSPSPRDQRGSRMPSSA